MTGSAYGLRIVHDVCMDEQSAGTFDDILSDANAPMAIVTTAADGRRAGCLVGFWMQCSLEPRRLLVCISHANHTASVAASGTHLCVHLPTRGTDAQLVRHFGEKTGDEVDKFAGIDWAPGPYDVPVLTGLAHIVGQVIASHGVGDHTAYVLDPVAANRPAAVRPVHLSDVNELDPGHPA